MTCKRPLPETEWYEALMRDSDDEFERAMTLEGSFSHIAENKDVLEESEGNNKNDIDEERNIIAANCI